MFQLLALAPEGGRESTPDEPEARIAELFPRAVPRADVQEILHGRR